MATIVRQIKMTALMHTGVNPAKANFIFAHPFLLEKSHTLHSPKFGNKALPHTYFKVTFRVSDAARVILTTIPLESGKIPDFVKAEYETLAKECERFENAALVAGAEVSPKLNDQIRFYKERIEKLNSDDVVEVTAEVETAPEPTLKSGICKVEGGYWLNNTFVDSANYDAFDMSLKVAEHEPVNILMIGPSGYGKTSIPEAFAEIHEMNFFRMNCAQVRDPEEWFGYREAKDGNTVFIPSDFTKAVTKGHCVIILDEFNRVEPWLHNTLYPLLDHARETIVHGETIKVGPNVIFVATANVGYQYVGSFQLDAAITNRMDLTLKVAALPKVVEIELLQKKCGINFYDAQKIVKVISTLRDLADSAQISGDVSTRTSLKIAKFVTTCGGGSLGDIARSVVFNNLNPQEVKTAIDAVAYML